VLLPHDWGRRKTIPFRCRFQEIVGVKSSEHVDHNILVNSERSKTPKKKAGKGVAGLQQYD
jgi:hypothetical protein